LTRLNYGTTVLLEEEVFVPDSIKASELPALVAKAVEYALRQQKVSEVDLNKPLHGPITIGLIASEKLGAAGTFDSFKAGTELSSVHNPHLIGFVAKDFAAIKKEIEM